LERAYLLNSGWGYWWFKARAKKAWN